MHILQNTFLSYIENAAFIWVQDLYKKGISIEYNMIREKSNSLYDNLKQKKGEGPKTRECQLCFVPEVREYLASK